MPLGSGNLLKTYQKYGLFFFASAILSVSTANAQSPADDFARRQAEQQKKQQIETLRKFTPQGNETPRLEQAIMPSDGRCFDIDHVTVEGAKKVSVGAIDKITNPYTGHCIGIADIQKIMKDLTNLYLDKGYVTARLYIPPQDIKKSRLLKFVVEEGILSDIYYNGKPVSPYDGVIMSSMPRMKGKVMNMRDVEQGLDQMNRLASNNAKSDILPGKEQGETILNVTNQPNKRWQINLSHDNLGQDSTGFARYNANLTLDNVLKINDLWNFGYQRTQRDYWNDNDLDGNSNSYSGSVSIPNGYWTFNVSGYYYEYKSTVPGNFGPINTSGDSSELRGSVGRLLHRDNKSLTTLNVGLAYKETNNFLLGNKIEVGSRMYTVANIDLSHSRQMLDGTWTFDLNYMQGLDWFGAVKKHDPGAGDSEPEFSKVVGTISVATPFKIKNQNFIVNNLLVGQYSPDNLFAAEQISIGSYSNVRGSRDSLLYGNNGFFTRNEIAWRTVPWGNDAKLVSAFGEFRPYVGLDYGQVFAQADWGFEDENLSSWTAGAKFVGGRINLDAGYSEIFSGTVLKNTGMAFASVSLTF